MPISFKPKAIEDTYTGVLPEIAIHRIVAVYIRQSGKDADTNNGESRKTQLLLRDFALKLVKGDVNRVRVYDEGAGKNGQKRIDERPELNRLWADLDTGVIGAIIVSREDRLFRNRHMDQVGLFTKKAEAKSAVVIVPLLAPGSKLHLYDFSKGDDLKAFQP